MKKTLHNCLHQFLKIWLSSLVQGAYSVERKAWPLLPLPLRQRQFWESLYAQSPPASQSVQEQLLPNPLWNQREGASYCAFLEAQNGRRKEIKQCLAYWFQAHPGNLMIMSFLEVISFLIVNLNCTGLGNECVPSGSMLCMCEHVCICVSVCVLWHV